MDGNNAKGQHTENALAKLLELSRTLATSHSLDAALTQAVNSAMEIVPAADRCTLQWLGSSGDSLHTVALSDTGVIPEETGTFSLGEGVAGRAFASKQTINVPDVLEDERFLPSDQPQLCRSLLVAPLVVEDHALGTLSLSSREIGAFSATDESLARLIADQIAAALQKANELAARTEAGDALRRTTERLKTRLEIDQSILAARSPETIAVAAIARIRRLIPCQRAMVLAIKEAGGIQMLAAQSSGEITSATDIELYQEICSAESLQRGWVQGAVNLAELPQRTQLQQSMLEAGARSFIAVPLFIQGELVGVLDLESAHPGTFTPDHITIATEVAASLAIAIRQARLYERAQTEIAERKRAEEQLRQHAAQLESHNAELDAFAHTVAHDLKNPVTTIVGYSELLKNKRSGLPETMVQEALKTITQTGYKMQTIIDELLLLSSVRGAEEVETQPLDMKSILIEVQKRLFYVIERHRGMVVYPPKWPVVIGYAPWVEEVWTNYISNALKYGGRPPQIELGYSIPDFGVAGLKPRPEKHAPDIQIREAVAVRFWVRDNGPGLSPDQQARLFTPFERLHQVGIEGHGLGLSIVRRIVEKLGGQVGVESLGVPDQGSTFYFTLPAAPGSQKN